VSRTSIIVVILAVSPFLLPAQEQKKQEPKTQEVEPPDEAETAKSKKTEYEFNPIQSGKELQIGNFYWKKGSYKSAKTRFDEATKWDPGNAEAWLRLGDACDKLKDGKGAQAAWSKYLELAPDAKLADAIRKKLAKSK
jgi:tetratricopeptide (TPR) repeat protein